MLPLESVDWTWDWTVMLRDALRLVLELESYQLSSRQRPKLVRGTHLEEYPHWHQTTSPGATSSTNVLQQLFNNVGRSNTVGWEDKSHAVACLKWPNLLGVQRGGAQKA